MDYCDVFISCLTLILTAPIHSGEQVMFNFWKSVLIKKQLMYILDGLGLSKWHKIWIYNISLNIRQNFTQHGLVNKPNIDQLTVFPIFCILQKKKLFDALREFNRYLYPKRLKVHSSNLSIVWESKPRSAQFSILELVMLCYVFCVTT